MFFLSVSEKLSKIWKIWIGDRDKKLLNELKKYFFETNKQRGKIKFPIMRM